MVKSVLQQLQNFLEELKLPSVTMANETNTGVSAHYRASTSRKLVDPRGKLEGFVRHGHTISLCLAPGGALYHFSHTEALEL